LLHLTWTRFSLSRVEWEIMPLVGNRCGTDFHDDAFAAEVVQAAQRQRLARKAPNN
jgi:hypothetical protein